MPINQPAASGAKPKRRLLQVLGVAFGVAVIVGNTIGAGILRTPGEVAGHLPSPAAFLGVWVFGGLYALLATLSLAELGVMLPRSGGQYVFAAYTFGRFAGFVIGWTDWVSLSATVAAIAIVIGEYTGEMVPGLDSLGPAVAMAAVLFFVALQWRGIRWGDRTQQATTVLKAVAMLVLVGVCFLLPAQAAAVPTSGAVPAGSVLTGMVLALQAVIYTYDGWNGVLYFSEELRDPSREIPRSMIGGVLAVIAIYLLLNAAFLYVLGISGLAGSTFPAGDASRLIFGPRGDLVIRVLMIVSLASSLNANLLMGSRIPYAMSRDGLFWSRATAVSESGTPTVTLAATTLLVLLLIVTGTFATAIAIATFFFVLQYLMSFSAVFVLRRREPERARSFRTPGFPLTTGLTLVGSAAFLVAAVVQDRSNSLLALGLLALSYPVYRLGPSRAAGREGGLNG